VAVLALGILMWTLNFPGEFYAPERAGPVSVYADGRARPAPALEPQVLADPGSSTSRGGAAPRTPMEGGEGVAALEGSGGALPHGTSADTDPESSQEPSEGPDATGTTQPLAPIVEDVELLYANGDLRAKGQRVDGLRSGPWIEFYEGGEDKLAEGSYERDMRHGHWRFWFSNTKLQAEGDYLAGRRDGLWKRWHDTGRPMREGSYRENERHGEWIQYYTNGQVMERGHYVNGLREGYWEFFDFEGRVEKRTGHYHGGARQD